MKYLKTICLTAVVITIAACSTSKTEDKTGKEYTSEYVCPMHCEGSGSDSAGVCPVCGMDYVKNENKED